MIQVQGETNFEIKSSLPASLPLFLVLRVSRSLLDVCVSARKKRGWRERRAFIGRSGQRTVATKTHEVFLSTLARQQRGQLDMSLSPSIRTNGHDQNSCTNGIQINLDLAVILGTKYSRGKDKSKDSTG